MKFAIVALAALLAVAQGCQSATCGCAPSLCYVPAPSPCCPPKVDEKYHFTVTKTKKCGSCCPAPTPCCPAPAQCCAAPAPCCPAPAPCCAAPAPCCAAPVSYCAAPAPYCGCAADSCCSCGCSAPTYYYYGQTSSPCCSSPCDCAPAPCCY